MFNTIWYLNIDLMLESTEDLSALAAALASRGVPPLYPIQQGADETWCGTFNTRLAYREPEPNIAAMLAAVESLEEPLRSFWMGCSLREFNIGYDCGAKPWAFNQGLSNELLARLARAGGSLRITLYPADLSEGDEPGAEADASE